MKTKLQNYFYGVCWTTDKLFSEILNIQMNGKTPLTDIFVPIPSR